MAELTVTVAQLQLGDRLLGSGQVVASLPVAGLNTPRGRLELMVWRGKLLRRVVWNARTTMKVGRGGTCAHE